MAEYRDPNIKSDSGNDSEEYDTNKQSIIISKYGLDENAKSASGLYYAFEKGDISAIYNIMSNPAINPYQKINSRLFGKKAAPNIQINEFKKIIGDAKAAEFLKVIHKKSNKRLKSPQEKANELHWTEEFFNTKKNNISLLNTIQSKLTDKANKLEQDRVKKAERDGSNPMSVRNTVEQIHAKQKAAQEQRKKDQEQRRQQREAALAKRARAEAQKARLADERAAAKLEAEQLKAKVDLEKQSQMDERQFILPEQKNSQNEIFGSIKSPNDESIILQAGQKPITDNKHNPGFNTDGTPIAPPITPAPEVRFLKSTAENEIEQRAKEALRKAQEASKLRREEEESRRQAEAPLSGSSNDINSVNNFDKITKLARESIIEPQNELYLGTGIKNVHELSGEELVKFNSFLADDPEYYRDELHLEDESHKKEAIGFAKLREAGINKSVEWGDNSGSDIRKVEFANGAELIETTHKEKIQIKGQIIESYREINFPLKMPVDKDNPEPFHMMMTIKDKNGDNMPENGALYFTAHYNEKGKLMEMAYPFPIKFAKGDGTKSKSDIGYIEHNGEIHTLPITRGKFNKMHNQMKTNQKLQKINLAQIKGFGKVLKGKLIERGKDEYTPPPAKPKAQNLGRSAE